MSRSRLAWGLLAASGLLLSSHVVRAQVPAPPTVRISIEPTVPGVVMQLHGIDDGRPDYSCDSACVLEVIPGRYQLGVADARDHWTLETLDLARSETLEVHPRNRSAMVAGGILAGTGLVAAGAGLSAALYYTVNGLEQSDCVTSCGPNLSRNVLRAGLIGMGAGALLAVAGGILVFSNADPSVVERPALTSFLSPRPGRFALALLPAPGTRAPYAIALFSF